MINDIHNVNHVVGPQRIQHWICMVLARSWVKSALLVVVLAVGHGAAAVGSLDACKRFPSVLRRRAAALLRPHCSCL